MVLYVAYYLTLLNSVNGIENRGGVLSYFNDFFDKYNVAIDISVDEVCVILRNRRAKFGKIQGGCRWVDQILQGAGRVAEYLKFLRDKNIHFLAFLRKAIKKTTFKHCTQ